MTEFPPDFTGLPDLASRSLGGSVVFANDEFFAEKENLIKPGPAAFDATTYGHKGKVYDGWETRRRREPGHDYAIVRLGGQGVVHGVIVDTAFFTGNYPPEISVEAARADGYPALAELAGLDWNELVSRAPAGGDRRNSYPVSDRRLWSHLRLSIYPDGGVARLRAHGEIIPDPDYLTGTINLAAMENGARVTGCSDAFYSAPANLLMPGQARDPSEGWENARRRDLTANDYVVVQLAGPAFIQYAEIDTSCFLGNAPAQVALSVADHAGAGGWELLPRTRLQPDTRHRFRVDSRQTVTQVRLDVFPDGGLARFRLYGELTPAALAAAGARWNTGTSGG
jgi:allantoicase